MKRALFVLFHPMNGTRFDGSNFKAVRRLAILLLFMTGICLWNLCPPWIVELDEPEPCPSDPTGFTDHKVEHHPIFWEPKPVANAATSKLAMPAGDGTMTIEYRETRLDWRSLLLGNALLIGAMIVCLFLHGRIRYRPTGSRNGAP